MASLDNERLHGQEHRLHGAEWVWKPFTPYNDDKGHDHCSFCGATFAAPHRLPNALHEGYATPDNRYWICEHCFHDYKDRFAWTLRQNPGDEPNPGPLEA